MTDKLIYDSQVPFFMGFYESMFLSETDLEKDLEYVQYYTMSSIEVHEFIDCNSYLWNKFKAENKAKGKRNYKNEFIKSWARENDPCIYDGLSRKEAEIKTANKYSEFVFSHLNLSEFGIKEILPTGVWSPSEYNFTTDTAEIRIHFENKELFKEYIQNLVLSGNEGLFNNLIDYKHSSYDGFSSFYSNNPQDWFNFDFKAIGRSSDFDNVMLNTYLSFILIVELVRNYNDETEKAYSEITDFNDLISSIRSTLNWKVAMDN